VPSNATHLTLFDDQGYIIAIQELDEADQAARGGPLLQPATSLVSFIHHLKHVRDSFCVCVRSICVWTDGFARKSVGGKNMDEDVEIWVSRIRGDMWS